MLIPFSSLCSKGSRNLVKNIYDYSGAQETLVIPAGVTLIHVKMWGAGGGGATSQAPFAGGGAGGYLEGDISTTPGETINIWVGAGGQPSFIHGGTNPSSAWLYGGVGGNDNDKNYTGASGGGMTVLQRATGGVLLAFAGAGGGAGAQHTSPGGGAGGTSGLDGGYYSSLPNTRGRGGTQVAGGAGGTGTYNGTAGVTTDGGNGAPTPAGYGGHAAGGGGAGYKGGGGGGATAGYGGGAGGGSSYSGGLTNAVNQAGASGNLTGTAAAPYNSTDVDNGGKGFGGYNSAGQNGRIVISYYQ